METEAVVTRAVGFAPPAPFVAEVTTEVMGGGTVTVREYGATAATAAFRATTAAASRLHARARRSGFYTGGFEYRTPSFGAAFPVGFAGAA